MSETTSSPPSDWLIGGGEAAALVRSIDWTATPLGPRDQWPPGLRTVVNLLVASQFPMALLWGRDLILLYNDAYRIICADKHPRAMGRSTREIWPEVWHINEPIFRAVLERGETIYREDKLFPIDRHGRREDAYFTLCYSPVRGEDGRVVGSLVTLLETTGRVREHEALSAERDRATRALEEREERLRLAIDATGIGAFDYDPETGRMEWSPNIRRHFGLPGGAAPDYETFLAAIHPDDRDRVDGLVQESMRPGSTGEYLAEYRTIGIEDRQERWLYARGRVMRDLDGQAVRFVGVTLDITERRRAEEAVRESENRFRTMANAMPQLGWIANADGYIHWYNDRWYAYTGTTPSQMEGWGWQSVHDPEALPAVLERWKGSIASGEPFDMVFPLRGADGRLRPFLTRVQPLKDSAGRVVQWFGTNTDVSEIEAVREALRESEERLRLAQEVARVGSFEWNIETGEIVWSQALEAIHGLPPGGFAKTQTGWEQLVHPEDRQAAVAKVEEALASGRPVEGEWRVIWPDRSVHWVAGRFQAFKDVAGKPLRLTGVNIDVTERKRAEDARRESEEKYRQLFERMREGFAYCRMVFDDHRDPADVIYLNVNDAFARLTGLENVIGKRLTEVVPGIREANPEVFEIYGRVAETGEPERFETYVPALASWLAISVYSPKKDHFVAVFDNITDRKRAEEELKEANVRLIDADRGKNEFLAVLSHELRNPLAAVRTAVHLLEHVPPAGEHANRARRVIDRQTAQLTRLVDDLLDVTRISRGKIQIQVEPVELTGLVRRTAEDHRALFATNGIEFELQVPDEPLWVDGDSQRLAQVIGNLLHNAAKFTERGGRTVALVGKDRNGREAIITVRDTGVGISAQALPHLFQPFMQVDNTLDRARGGLGLGLALVKSLVEMHGGTVSARSAGVGLGSEFTLRLPLCSAPSMVSVVGESAAHRRRRVLIIEDNVDAADSLRHALALAGHEVEVAYDGPEGVEKARDFAPEIVLCDIGLPGLNGYDVARTLRNDATLASVRLVALTGYALPEDVAKAREAGFDLHLAKPASPEKLQDALR